MTKRILQEFKTLAGFFYYLAIQFLNYETTQQIIAYTFLIHTNFL